MPWKVIIIPEAFVLERQTGRALGAKTLGGKPTLILAPLLGCGSN
jgi:hypothetical protein